LVYSAHFVTFKFQLDPPGGLTDPDYRDIAALDENTAIVMAIAAPASFFKVFPLQEA
jgi:hypothetical protein